VNLKWSPVSSGFTALSLEFRSPRSLEIKLKVGRQSPPRVPLAISCRFLVHHHLRLGKDVKNTNEDVVYESSRPTEILIKGAGHGLRWIADKFTESGANSRGWWVLSCLWIQGLRRVGYTQRKVRFREADAPLSVIPILIRSR